MDNKVAAIDSLVLLREPMQQILAFLAGDDVGDRTKASTAFLYEVVFESVNAGKWTILNNLMDYPILPMEEKRATPTFVVLDIERDKSDSNKDLVVVLEGKIQNFLASNICHLLQGRLTDACSIKGKSEGIQLTLCSKSTLPLKVIDLPRLG